MKKNSLIFRASGTILAACAAIALSACSPKKDAPLSSVIPENSTFALYSKTDKAQAEALRARADYKEVIAALKADKVLKKKYADFQKTIPEKFAAVLNMFVDKDDIAGSIECLTFGGIDESVIYTPLVLKEENGHPEGTAIIKTASADFADKIWKAVSSISDAKAVKIDNADALEIALPKEEGEIDIKIFVCKKTPHIIAAFSREEVETALKNLREPPKKSIRDDKYFSRVVPNADVMSWAFFSPKFVGENAKSFSDNVEAVGFSAGKSTLSEYNIEVCLLFKEKSPMPAFFSTCSFCSSKLTESAVESPTMFMALALPQLTEKLIKNIEAKGLDMSDFTKNPYGKVLLNNLKSVAASVGKIDVPAMFQGKQPSGIVNFEVADADKILNAPEFAQMLAAYPKKEIGKIECREIPNVGLLAKISNKRISLLLGSEAEKLIDVASGKTATKSAGVEKLLNAVKSKGGFFEFYADYNAFLQMQLQMSEQMRKQMIAAGQTPPPQSEMMDKYYKILASLCKKYEISCNISSQGDTVRLKMHGECELDLFPAAKAIREMK